MPDPKPPKAPKAPVEKRIYNVLSPIAYDNAPYGEGDQIELNDKQAAELVACGAIKGA